MVITLIPMETLQELQMLFILLLLLLTTNLFVMGGMSFVF